MTTSEAALQWYRVQHAVSSLAFMREAWLHQRGLSRQWLNTQFNHIWPANKNALANWVIPHVMDKPTREILLRNLNEQHTWPLFEHGRSAWAYSRQMEDAANRSGLAGMGEALKEDLLVLGYDTLVSQALGEVTRLRRGVEDFLLNDLYLLEEVRLAAGAEQERQPPTPPSGQPGGTVVQLLQYADFEVQLHLQNAVNRIRAGWDKLLRNVLLEPLQVKDIPDRFSKKATKLRDATIHFSGFPRSFLENLVDNATNVAGSELLLLRDQDLHYISHQATEVFGRPGKDRELLDFWNVVLSEHQRLEQSFLLGLASLTFQSRADSPPEGD